MAIPNQVVSYGFPLDDFTFTYLYSGTLTEADLGNAMTLDTATANTMKLVGDNDQVDGRLVAFVNDVQLGIKTCAVQRKFKEKVKKTAAAIALGASVTGSATAGLVKSATAQDTKYNRVVELLPNDYVVVEQL